MRVEELRDQKKELKQMQPERAEVVRLEVIDLS